MNLPEFRVEDTNKQQHTVESCTDGICARTEIATVEFSEHEEAFVDNFTSAIHLWQMSIEQAKLLVDQLYAALDRNIDKELGMADHIGIRDLQRGSQRKRQAERLHALVDARNSAKQIVVETTSDLLPEGLNVQRLTPSQNDGEYTLPEYLDVLSTVGKRIPISQDDLYARLEDDERFGSIRFATSGELVVNPYLQVFIIELVAKSLLGLGYERHPHVMGQMFAVEGIHLLEPALRQFAAVDIARGKERSYILHNFLSNRSERTTSGMTINEKLPGYMSRNSLTVSARDRLAAIAAGACAAGAQRCLANRIGLCEAVAAKLDEKDVGQEVIADMARKEKESVVGALTEYRDFSSYHGASVPKMWRWDSLIVEQGHPGSKVSTRRSKRSAAVVAEVATARMIDESAESVEAISHKNLHITWSGQTEPIIGAINDEDRVSAILEAILESRNFTDYFRKYSGEQGMEVFMEHALRTIMKPGGYRDEASIIQMHNLRHIYIDGRKLSVWRLSGNDLAISSQRSKGVRDTRVLFAVAGNDESKVVHIIGPRHKADIVKPAVRGTTLN